MSFCNVSHRGSTLLVAMIAISIFYIPRALRLARGNDAEQAAATSFSGKFTSDKLTLELAESGAGYAGTITFGNDQFPAKATAAGGNLSGSFVASGAEFAFTATFADGRLVLASGGKTYSLAKVARNPLAAIPPAGGAPDHPPVAPAPPDGSGRDISEPFGDFTVLGATDTGKTLFIKLPTAQTFEATATQTADDLGKVFDAKPELSGAYVDSKGNKGIVSVKGKLKGQDVRGMIFCGFGEKGGTSTVIFAGANASKEEVAALYANMPAPPLKMQTHKYPDGSGSVDLPEGWTSPTQTAIHGIAAFGPAGQTVIFNMIVPVKDPNCRIVQMSRQTYQIKLNMYQRQLKTYEQNVEARKRFPGILALQEPQKPAPPDPDPNVNSPFVDFCPYCDGPEDVLKVWLPMREAKQKRAGKPYTTVDKVFEIVPLPVDPRMVGSKAGAVYMALSNHDGDKVTHVRALDRIQTAHIVDGEVWQLSTSTMRAPDETFDRDLPVMNAIMSSVNLDMNVVEKETQAETDAALKLGQQMFEQLQKRNRDFQDQQAVRFNNFERQMAAQQQARHDSASDFIEYIGGVRRVYDTRTGQALDVDLFNSNGIVNGLNEIANDPNRFVQVPLRYLR